jgi:hypothetical protein
MAVAGKAFIKWLNPQDMWHKHEETGQLVMMLQEEIEFDDYFAAIALAKKTC